MPWTLIASAPAVPPELLELPPLEELLLPLEDPPLLLLLLEVPPPLLLLLLEVPPPLLLLPLLLDPPPLLLEDEDPQCN